MNEALTNDQSNEKNRCDKQMLFFGLAPNIIKINSYQPFKDEVDILRNQLIIINDAGPNKTVQTIDISEGKSSLKHDFANFKGGICMEGLAYGKKYSIPIVHDMMQTSDIYQIKDGEIVSFAQHIKDVLEPRLVDMSLKHYTTTMADLDMGIMKAGDFAATIGNSGVVASGGTVAGGVIADAFKVIAGVQDQFILLRGHWKNTDHDFYEGIILNSIVDHLGHIYTGMKGVVTSGASNASVGDATITNERTGKSTTANVLGAYVMQGMHPHLDNYRISGPGLADLIVPIQTKFRETIVVNFHLEPI